MGVHTVDGVCASVKRTPRRARRSRLGGVELFVVAIAGPVLIRAGVARAHVIDEEDDDVGVHVSPYFHVQELNAQIRGSLRG